MAVIFVFQSARKSQTLYGTLNTWFQSNALNSVQPFKDKSKNSQSIRDQGAQISIVYDKPENLNLVKDTKLLLLSIVVKFRSAFAELVDNASANQSPGRSSLLSDWPE